MKAELVPENGDPPIPITRDVTVLGRREYCDVVIADPSLSKRHCLVVKTDGLLVIRDLATTNGTKVKGQRIRWAALLPDDRIAMGSYKFRVYLGPDDQPSPSERASRAAAGASGSRRAQPMGFAPPSMPELPSEQFDAGLAAGAAAKAAAAPEEAFDDVIVLDEVDLLDAATPADEIGEGDLLPDDDDVIELT